MAADENEPRERMEAPKPGMAREAAREAIREAARTASILFIFVVVFTGLLSGVYLWTLPALEASAAAEKIRRIDEILPRAHYDNDLLNDAALLPPTPELGLDRESRVYRARKNGTPAALVFETVAPDGYAGKIRLLIALDVSGAQSAVLGVRVTEHRETPGLGDFIDIAKDRNKAHPWIRQFDGLIPAQLPERAWRVKKDGGRFDSLAGATVTPRAVVKAVGKAVRYADAERGRLFRLPRAVEDMK